MTIYQTMTGELQCVLIDGILYIREWDAKIQHQNVPNPNKWTKAPNVDQSVDLLNRRLVGVKSGRSKYRMNCMIHTLTESESPFFKVKLQSEIIELKIKDIKASLRIAKRRDKAEFNTLLKDIGIALHQHTDEA